MQRIAVSIALTIASVMVVGDVGTFAGEKENEKPATKSDNKISLAEFDHLHKKLTSMSTQRVWSIPWQLSVRTARELAVKQNKPVFLWISSNGGTHPLGPC